MLAPYLRKFGRFTVPAFFADRVFKSAAAMAVICLLVASITYIIGQMTGVGVAFSRFLGVSNGWGVYIGMGIVFCYAIVRRHEGITYTRSGSVLRVDFRLHYSGDLYLFQLTVPIPQLGLGASWLARTLHPAGQTEPGGYRARQAIHYHAGQTEYVCLHYFPDDPVPPFTLSSVSSPCRPLPTPATQLAGRSFHRDSLHTTAPAVAAMARLNLHMTTGFEIRTGAPLVAEGRTDAMKNVLTG